jgi:hypothetical protein
VLSPLRARPRSHPRGQDESEQINRRERARRFAGTCRGRTTFASARLVIQSKRVLGEEVGWGDVLAAPRSSHSRSTFKRSLRGVRRLAGRAVPRDVEAIDGPHGATRCPRPPKAPDGGLGVRVGGGLGVAVAVGLVLLVVGRVLLVVVASRRPRRGSVWQGRPTAAPHGPEACVDTSRQLRRSLPRPRPLQTLIAEGVAGARRGDAPREDDGTVARLRGCPPARWRRGAGDA